VFGTERPGSGTTRNPRTGYDYDDIKQTIDGFGWLGDYERAAIYEGNARALFPRLSL
jgi:4-oxalmesaconate hydratase